MKIDSSFLGNPYVVELFWLSETTKQDFCNTHQAILKVKASRKFNLFKMSWSTEQRTRLGFEKDIIDGKLTNVTWINPTSAGNTRVEWRVNTNNGNNYTLRVYVPAKFPNECPVLVVSSPSSVLKKKDGSLLQYSSGQDHVYGMHDGLTEICHFRKDSWSSENTIYQVLMKGRIWLEAYEIHRQTGEYLEKYLAHMNWFKGKTLFKNFNCVAT